MGSWASEAGAVQHVIGSSAGAQTSEPIRGRDPRHLGFGARAGQRCALLDHLVSLVGMQTTILRPPMALAPRRLAPQQRAVAAAAAGRRRSPPSQAMLRSGLPLVAEVQQLRQRPSSFSSLTCCRRSCAAAAASAAATPPLAQHAAPPKLPGDDEAVLAGNAAYRPPAPLPEPPSAGTLGQVGSGCLLPAGQAGGAAWDVACCRACCTLRSAQNCLAALPAAAVFA